MLDGRWRAGVERGLGPVGDRLRRTGITPDALTILGLAFSVGTAVLIATGRLGWAVAGIIVSGIADLLDGTVARHSGQTSPRGAFFDSVADRVSDAVLLGGVAWYLAGVGPHLPVLAFTVAALSMVVSYERAKAEALGLTARGGLMERAERFVFLGAGLAFDILVPVLWAMLALTAITALSRFRQVWRQADRPPRRQTVHTRRRRIRADVAGPGEPSVPRLRTWWETRRPGSDRWRNRHPRVRRRTRP